MVCRSSTDKQTNKQTNRQTNKKGGNTFFIYTFFSFTIATVFQYMYIGTKHAITKIYTMQLGSLRINNTEMERVRNTKILGVTFDEVLSWRKNVNLCISKSMGNFFQISRYKKFLNRESKM